MMNDGTIGNGSSSASTRANDDCVSLFTLLWNNVLDAWAPVTPGGRGASAAADWASNKAIQLTRQLGRALGVAGAGSGLTTRALGSTVGEERHTMTTGEMVQHAHAFANTLAMVTTTYVVDAGTSNTVVTFTGGLSATSNAGSTTPFNVMQPTSFWNVMIKL